MDFFNWLSEFFSSLSDKLIGILPKSPFYYLEMIPEVKQYLGMLNWFIPIYSMLSLAELWLTAIVVYYVVQGVLRWIKIIE